MRNRFWGIGEKAKNINKLKKGDKAVFYLGDSGQKRFFGTATINSKFLNEKLAQIRGHDFSGVELVNIEPWDEPKPLDKMEKKLKMTADKSDYRQCLRGSIREIEKEDYVVIVGMENSVEPVQKPKKKRSQSDKAAPQENLVRG
jgi:predicted RNA-binding protein with PUA-like domain